MIAQPRPLMEIFADIPDFRNSKGKHHPLAAILSLALARGGVRDARQTTPPIRLN